PAEMVRETAALRTKLKALSKRYDQLLNDLDESGEPAATTPESEAVFARILAAEEELTARARELKAVARTPAARNSLVAMLNTESKSPEQEKSDRSIVLAQSLASTGDPAAYAAIATFLLTADPTARRSLFFELARSPTESAYTFLLEHSRSSTDPAERGYLYGLLPNVGSPSLATDLGAALANETDFLAAGAAGNAFRRSAVPGPGREQADLVTTLAKAAGRGAPQLRIAATHALAHVGTAEAHDTLRQLLETAVDVDVRDAAVTAMAETAPPEDLLELLQGEEVPTSVLVRVIHTAANRRLEEAVPSLVDLLRTPDVQHQAGFALNQITGEELRPAHAVWIRWLRARDEAAD
ncbi:MAG: HEAT repeat domain-containing protein, partial [Planctomycetota bacterium]